MTQRDPGVYLEHIENHAQAALRFVAGYDLDTYLADEKTRAAVERVLEFVARPWAVLAGPTPLSRTEFHIRARSSGFAMCSCMVTPRWITEKSTMSQSTSFQTCWQQSEKSWRTFRIQRRNAIDRSWPVSDGHGIAASRRQRNHTGRLNA